MHLFSLVAVRKRWKRCNGVVLVVLSARQLICWKTSIQRCLHCLAGFGRGLRRSFHSIRAVCKYITQMVLPSSLPVFVPDQRTKYLFNCRFQLSVSSRRATERYMLGVLLRDKIWNDEVSRIFIITDIALQSGMGRLYSPQNRQQ